MVWNHPINDSLLINGFTYLLITLLLLAAVSLAVAVFGIVFSGIVKVLNLIPNFAAARTAR